MKTSLTKCDICGKVRESDRDGFEYETYVDTFDEVSGEYWLCNKCGNEKGFAF